MTNHYILGARTSAKTIGEHRTMNKEQTAAEIDNAIADLITAERTLHDRIRNTGLVYPAKIDQSTKQISDVIGHLEDQRDELLGGIYAQVRDAISTDRQYVYGSILQWQSRGDDIETIATNLETTTDVLIDIIDEFVGRA